jgi:hypothetical protein
VSSAAHADENGSRWIAAMPFGAGQIQNGDTGLGVFFAVGEALLGGATITTVAGPRSRPRASSRRRCPSATAAPARARP